MPLLEPGRYSVSVHNSGFQTITRSDIVLNVNQVARLDFAMRLGETTKTVLVTAAAPLVNSAQSSLAGMLDSKKVWERPLNGRNPFDLALLVPGVTAYGRPDRSTARRSLGGQAASRQHPR